MCLFSFSSVVYGSAVYAGDIEPLECMYCITPEELEFRNENPELFDRIGIKIYN